MAHRRLGWGDIEMTQRFNPHRAWMLPLQRLYSHGLPLAGANPPPYQAEGICNLPDYVEIIH